MRKIFFTLAKIVALFAAVAAVGGLFAASSKHAAVASDPDAERGRLYDALEREGAQAARIVYTRTVPAHRAPWAVRYARIAPRLKVAVLSGALLLAVALTVATIGTLVR